MSTVTNRIAGLMFAWTALWAFSSISEFPSEKYSLTHVSVIDVRDGFISSNMKVTVTGDRISEITKMEGTVPRTIAKEIDASGKFLIPGLWDMHVHVAQTDKAKWARSIMLPLLIANGVTGVRDMGDNFDVVQQLRREIKGGKLLGPRIVAAGPQLIGAGSETTWSEADWPATDFVRVGSARDAQRTVRSLKNRGVDFIKVQSEGPPLSREAYFEIAQTARKLGIPFVGHVPDAITVGEASNAGQKSVEHLNGIFLACSTNETRLRKAAVDADLNPLAFPSSNARSDFDLPPRGTLETYSDVKASKLFVLLASNQTWQVPTLIFKRNAMLWAKNGSLTDDRLTFIPPGLQEAGFYYKGDLSKLERMDVEDISNIFKQSLAVVRVMQQAGVKFMAGTDTPFPPFPGAALLDEIGLLVQAGLTPLEALQAATLNPAIFLGRLQEFGTVEKNKVADLVLLDANPLTNIENVRKIQAVVLNGTYLSRDELDNMLARTKAVAARP